jgi:hypothetical protein
MKEGTWMVEKPKRKTPPSQDKGTAGSSGGVKRPHSDSSTPSQEKQQPKKPRCRLEPARKLLLESRWQLLLHPDVNLDQKVYIVTPLTTRISWEMTGGESWNI